MRMRKVHLMPGRTMIQLFLCLSVGLGSFFSPALLGLPAPAEKPPGLALYDAASGHILTASKSDPQVQKLIKEERKNLEASLAKQAGKSSGEPAARRAIEDLIM